MKTRYFADQVRYQTMTSEELRNVFLIEKLFRENSLDLFYTEADRGIVGSAVPVTDSLKLAAGKEIVSEYFTERREIGVINIGSTGTITVDGESYILENLDGLYIGRSSREVLFSSKDSAKPAKFYLLSYPAHKVYPTKKIVISEAETQALGSQENANNRVIYKYIHPSGIKSCQLVMGFTVLASGNVWNTMAPHTHERRSEIYLYFDLGDDILFHFMGKPEQTKHLVVRNGQAVMSPSWSIHSGVGTKHYSFVWGMGGENQDFDDMDFIDLGNLQ